MLRILCLLTVCLATSQSSHLFNHYKTIAPFHNIPHLSRFFIVAPETDYYQEYTEELPEPFEVYDVPNKPKTIYAPPISSTSYGLPYKPPKPATVYGPPPKPAVVYGPPPKPAVLNSPPPKPVKVYGPPKPATVYGPPPKPVKFFLPPPKPAAVYGPPPKPAEVYGPPPKPATVYGPPPKPFSVYGPPTKPSTFEPSVVYDVPDEDGVIDDSRTFIVLPLEPDDSEEETNEPPKPPVTSYGVPINSYNFK